MNTRAQQANTKTCAIALFSYGRSAQICFADKAPGCFRYRLTTAQLLWTDPGMPTVSLSFKNCLGHSGLLRVPASAAREGCAEHCRFEAHSHKCPAILWSVSLTETLNRGLCSLTLLKTRMISSRDHSDQQRRWENAGISWSAERTHHKGISAVITTILAHSLQTHFPLEKLVCVCG